MIDSLWNTLWGKIALSSVWMLLAVVAWKWWPQHWRRQAQLCLLIGLALGVRGVAWQIPASDDVHRYMWEGQLVLDGLSPYAAPAADPQYHDRHDAHWQRMNHKESRTAYPPLALLLCAAVDKISPTVEGFKFAASVADLALIALLVLAVTHWRWVALYALNPVPLISYAGEGHFDAFMVLAMVGSIVCIARPRWAWTLLAVAIGIKYVALIFLPLLWSHTPKAMRWQALGGFGLTLVIPALPFLRTLPALGTGAAAFATQTSSNATLHWLLELVTGSKFVASLVCGLVLFWYVFKERWRLAPSCIEGGGGTPPLLEVTLARGNATALLLTAPTVTYWYVGWGLPFAVLAPSPALWVLSATDVFYYAAQAHFQTHGVWWHPRWAWALEWWPFVGVWGWSRWQSRAKSPG